MYTYKVRIHPNNKQKTKILSTMNKCIECNNIIYDILDASLKESKGLPKCSDIRKQFTIIKKQKDNETIQKRINLTHKEQTEKHLDVLFCDVSNDALKQMVKDTYNSFVRFLKKISKYPVKKTYKYYKKSMYVDPYKIEFTSNKVKLEKIANSTKKNRLVLNYVKLAEKNRIPIKEENKDIKYYNPRVVYDGQYFSICVGVEDEYKPKKNKELNETNNGVIGLDMNISNIVTYNSDTSIDKHYKTINNSKRLKREMKSFKRLQRSLSRKYITSVKNKTPLKSLKNFKKIKKKIRKKRERINNIRDDYQRRVVGEVINERPMKIVVETLDIKEMQMKKEISKYIQISSFRKFLNILKDKCIKHNVIIIEANKYYPSSKMCSNCHNKKDDLKISDRTYKCNKCGLVIDRDTNAAINLSRYKEI